MRTQYKLNIDRLEVCYTAPADIVKELINTQFHEKDCYRLISLNSSPDEASLAIDIPSHTDNGLEWARLGEIKIGSTFENEDSPIRYVWIRISNRMLYTPLYPDTSLACSLYYIADDLGLTFNNITKVEIALDSSVNYFKRLRKAIRTFVPIVIGKAYKDTKEVIDRVLYIHTGDRERYRTNSLLVSSKDKDMSLAVYDKSEEIANSHKDYISEWDGMKHIWRMEIRLKRRSLTDYLSCNNMSSEELYLRLFAKDMLFNLFLFFADRLIRFRNGRGTLNVLEV